ncbi:MAG: hypothetical protein Q7U68_00515 [Candidatus Roizmanbacteria bacterium]|nr:hypothetical protein [Candidatus Roizmanbacteria bacterium]
MYKKIMDYFKKHPSYNGAVHVITGMGIGILITYPLVGAHPVRWGVVLLLLGILGHLYPLTIKK